MTLDDLASLSQVIAAVGAILAVVASLYFTRRTLDEVREDRRLRQAPYLVWKPGPYVTCTEEVDIGPSVPGVNPAFIRQSFPELVARQGISILPTVDFGEIANIGAGAALEPSIVWIPDRICLGAEEFAVDDAKRSEPSYHRPLNTMPVVPAVLAAGEVGEITRLPAFIVKDYDRRVTWVKGTIELSCKDVGGLRQSWRQGFYLFTQPADEHPRENHDHRHVRVTVGLDPARFGTE
ncbi:hypothetical protein ACPW96_18070 [Micromonospora sp. DT81.3]|uniref:hypothetical protein n=1 Tax=Micromonospora sp. DT81.3 TaxID=3416523 RepID=UPI003CE7C28F